jgi:GNAT superfamily N-acetyltransferase
MKKASLPEFIGSLSSVAPPAGEGAYAFMDAEIGCRGWVQLIIRSDRRVEVHRLWTLKPGQNNGSMMLQTICDLADRHGIEIILKPLPFGRKPYPRTREQLMAWYERYGFAGNRRKMIRQPRALAPSFADRQA